MVDFQSRDTTRGSLTDDESDESSTADEQAADTADARDIQETDETEVELGVAIVAIGENGDSESSDSASDAVAGSIERAGWTVVAHETADSTYDAVQGTVDRTLGRRAVSAVVTVGSAGIGPSDVTVEAIEPLLDTSMPGFGELFRVQYFDRAGPNVVGMRPTAGVSDETPVFCLPGDADAARFAVETILADTLDSLVAQATDP
ncbi:Molybdopterin biosynthesis enzyme [Halorhabdus sp. SVX81]|uniref:MogA/MoaB family molybdenum cofactor biosynthesis protein n=1 Tax=Halorhabdus sp. SVX81 TaxID=2978283 RepID=UPI0023DC6F7B|nr:molybdopterin-binding protein [Halorhabdus sp. SVX81]WEL17325.1 Molybdopterin biosynthesis enzyme [Halorhabdus sp. SVX81]